MWGRVGWQSSLCAVFPFVLRGEIQIPWISPPLTVSRLWPHQSWVDAGGLRRCYSCFLAESERIHFPPNFQRAAKWIEQEMMCTYLLSTLKDFLGKWEIIQHRRSFKNRSNVSQE